jgi:hypothetical protein
MSDNFRSGEDWIIEEKLTRLLKRKKYKAILGLLSSQYGFKLCTEQSGATFEDCVDWCARKSRDIQEGAQILRLLFKRFYLYLPEHVRYKYAQLAAEVGYDAEITGLLQAQGALEE